MFLADKEHIKHRFEHIRKIGNGSSGCVIQAVSLEDGKFYALKWVIKMLAVYDHASEIRTEVDSLNILGDIPGVVGCYGEIPAIHGTFIVMEYCEDKDLLKRCNEEGPVTEAQGRAVISSLLETTNSMHAKNAVHRDIKPNNLVASFDAEGGGVLSVKLLDFGACYVLTPNKAIPFSFGTPAFQAPEVNDIASSYFAPGYESTAKKADMYSIGCTLYTILTGCLYNPLLLAEKKWVGLSAPAVDFVKNLVDPTPTNRMSASQALQHPFITAPSNSSV